MLLRLLKQVQNYKTHIINLYVLKGKFFKVSIFLIEQIGQPIIQTKRRHYCGVS